MRPTVIAALIIVVLAIAVVLLAMWPNVIMVLSILFTMAIVGGFVAEQHRRKLKRSRFTGRERVPVGTLVDGLADDVDSRERCVYWWNRAASLLEMDPTLLRPGDRFDAELAPVPGSITVDELGELDYLIEEMGLADKYKQQAPKPQTLGEYVRFLADAAPSTQPA